MPRPREPVAVARPPRAGCWRRRPRSPPAGRGSSRRSGCRRGRRARRGPPRRSGSRRDRPLPRPVASAVRRTRSGSTSATSRRAPAAAQLAGELEADVAAALDRHRPSGQLVRAPAVEGRGLHRPHHAVRGARRGIAEDARDVAGLRAQDRPCPPGWCRRPRRRCRGRRAARSPGRGRGRAPRGPAASPGSRRITDLPPPRGSPAMTFLKVMPRDSRRASVTASCSLGVGPVARAAHGRSRHGAVDGDHRPVAGFRVAAEDDPLVIGAGGELLQGRGSSLSPRRALADADGDIRRSR